MDDHITELYVNKMTLGLILKSVDVHLKHWPGGEAGEQEALMGLQTQLRAAYLEYQFLGDEGTRDK